MENQNHTEAARILDSITKLAPTDAGRVVIAASHGGSYAAYCAARGRVRAVVLNDAGVGWQQAGIAGLDELQQWGVAAATADYRSCRIGDGADMARHGIISHVNGLAHALGCRPGMAVAQAARRLADADMAPTWPAPRHEARAVLATPADGTPRVIGADSVSLLEADDDGRIAVTASHGERLAGLATDGVRPRPWLVTFNDAGIGKDSAGIGRLPLLQQRGIAALTVSAHSARIGDARSCYEDGVVSCANARARELGCRIGAPLKSFIDALLAGRATHLEHSPHVGNP
ncbi:hypothetical protein [Achromobacter insuavis]|uniref:hypothetical protein n=1 Tax=Achromobacter insuavis TaxID=1287735 RepID=UPI00359F7864